MSRCFGKRLFQAVRANLVTDGVQSREEERGGRGGGHAHQHHGHTRLRELTRLHITFGLENTEHCLSLRYQRV